MAFTLDDFQCGYTLPDVILRTDYLLHLCNSLPTLKIPQASDLPMDASPATGATCLKCQRHYATSCGLLRAYRMKSRQIMSFCCAQVQARPLASLSAPAHL